ncbi:MAG: HAD family hydrolase, partial [Nocardioidaceae bacterium]
MSFRPRLVALDIDGTILVPHPEDGYSDDTVTPAVRAAVDRALAAGALVVLASGRAPLSMSMVLRHLDIPRDQETQVLGVASN